MSVYPAGTRVVCPTPGCERPLAELVNERAPGDVLRSIDLRELDAARPIAAGGTLDCPEHGPIPDRLMLRQPDGKPVTG